MKTLSRIGLFALALAAPLRAQPGAQPLRGTWTASVGAKPVFHGTWTADLKADAPNAASGSWTLVNDANRIVAEGTWAAVKTAGAWSGTWSARILPPGGRAPGGGRVMSGSWRADVEPGRARTFADLLQSTLENAVTGSWKSGGRQGRWWLTASRQPGA